MQQEERLSKSIHWKISSTRTSLTGRLWMWHDIHDCKFTTFSVENITENVRKINVEALKSEERDK